MDRVPLKDWHVEPSRISGTDRWMGLSDPMLRQVLVVTEGNGWLGALREPLEAGNAYYFEPGDDTKFGSDDGMSFFSFTFAAVNDCRRSDWSCLSIPDGPIQDVRIPVPV